MPDGRTVGDRLAQARRQRFVGRADELHLFRALVGEADTGAVVFVHGPGGVGKTALLGRFTESREKWQAWPPSGWTPARSSRRRRRFCAIWPRRWTCPTGAPLDVLRGGRRHVLLVDTYEAAAPPDKLDPRSVPARPALRRRGRDRRPKSARTGVGGRPRLARASGGTAAQPRSGRRPGLPPCPGDRRFHARRGVRVDARSPPGPRPGGGRPSPATKAS